MDGGFPRETVRTSVRVAKAELAADAGHLRNRRDVMGSANSTLLREFAAGAQPPIASSRELKASMVAIDQS